MRPFICWTLITTSLRPTILLRVPSANIVTQHFLPLFVTSDDLLQTKNKIKHSTLLPYTLQHTAQHHITKHHTTSYYTVRLATRVRFLAGSPLMYIHIQETCWLYTDGACVKTKRYVTVVQTNRT